MRRLFEDLRTDNEADIEFSRRRDPRTIEELMEAISFLEKFKEEHGIESQKAKPGDSVHSIGFSDREQKWYGWSHRAIFGFGVGDKIFEPDYGDDSTEFDKHGSVTIKNMDDAKKSAVAFARYVG